jgi:hypothetical protein
VVESAWGAVLPIECLSRRMHPKPTVPQRGFVSEKLSDLADGWVRRRSGIPVRPASSNSRRRGYNFDAQGLGTGQDGRQRECSTPESPTPQTMLGKAMIVMAEVPGFGRMDQSTATQAVSRSLFVR